MIVRDGEWVLHSSDIKAGRYTWRRDNGDGTHTIRTDQHCDAVMDMNSRQRNLAESGWKGDWHHIAAIPKAIAMEHLLEAQSQGDDKFVSRWLNDSSNAAWRTKSGTV